MDTNTTSAPQLSTDQPRADPAEDLLGYVPFAQMLAHSVLSGSPASGLVVGLYGEWGLGKTTLLNFVEHFSKLDPRADTPIVVRFNPWWFSGREDLIRRFFKEFETAVRKSVSTRAKVRSVLLSALEKIGEASSSIPSVWVATPAKLIAAFARAGQQPADVIAIKDELALAMSAKELRVIVLIDDIDRLMPSEMTEIFRLVRSVGDLPNVHYVLAFDRQIVAAAISKECSTDGDRYLEKIVQAPFDLPRPSANTLQRMFTSRLEEVFSDTDAELFERHRWNEAFLTVIAPFLRTPRDVARLLNAIVVTFPIVKNEVNIVDFVAIETLRIFAPTSYGVIRSNRSKFVGIAIDLEHLRDENRQFHEQWLTSESLRNQALVRSLLSVLFPKVQAVLVSSFRPSINEVAMRTSRRICTEEVFDTYFRYSLERGRSRASFLRTIEIAPEELEGAMRHYCTERLEDGRSRLRWFLEMLRDELGSGRSLNVEALTTELCRLGDTMIATTLPTLSLQVPDDFLLVFVIERLLEQVPADERSQLLTRALNVAGTATAARIVTILGTQHGRHGEQAKPAETRTIPSSEQLDALEALVRARIERAWESDALWSSPGLARLLFDWKRLGGEDRAREAVRRWATSSPGNLSNLLADLSGLSSNGRRVIDLHALASLLDVDAAVAKSIEFLRGAAVEPAHRALLQSLLDASASAEPERHAARTRTAILSSILDLVAQSGVYPRSHTVRVAFERDRAVVDQLVQDQMIGLVANDHYMVSLDGLQAIVSDPRARRELAVCAALLRRLQTAFRGRDRAQIDMKELVVVMTGEVDGLTLAELRRAGLVLARKLPRGLDMTADGDGFPLTLVVSEQVLNLSVEEILRAPG